MKVMVLLNSYLRVDLTDYFLTQQFRASSALLLAPNRCLSKCHSTRYFKAVLVLDLGDEPETNRGRTGDEPGTNRGRTGDYPTTDLGRIRALNGIFKNYSESEMGISYRISLPRFEHTVHTHMLPFCNSLTPYYSHYGKKLQRGL